MDLMVTVEMDTHDHDAETVLPALEAALAPEAGAAFALGERSISVTFTGRSGDLAQLDRAEQCGQALTDALHCLDDALKTVQTDHNGDEMLTLSIVGRWIVEEYTD